MIKVPINDNYVMPSFQTVNKSHEQTQLILMDPQTNSLYLLHQYYCTHSDDYAELIALLETQATHGVQSPYLLNPLVYLPIKYTNQEFQTSHFVQVLYEYGSHTLEQQLYLRIQEKNYFEQHELWSILGSIVLGLKNLKDKQFTHSSVCMSDIFVTKQGQIKLCHPMFRTYDHTNSKQVEQHYFERAIGENYFFAPQQLPSHQQISPLNQKHSSSNQLHSQYQSDCQNQQSQSYEMSLEEMFKCDIFSVGMTMLSVCMLYPINDCYTKRSTKRSYQIDIDSDRLAQYFSALEQAYSQDLLGILFSMVVYNSEERISIDQLALIIQQMIQAKQIEEDENQLMQSNQSTVKRYQQDAKGSLIRKNNNSNDNTTSEERFGKFSRVSQASPLSGRKTPRSNHNFGAPLQYSPPDAQDKPSIPSIQSQLDYPNIDVQDYNNLSQSQANIDTQQDQNDQNNNTLKQQTKTQQVKIYTHNAAQNQENRQSFNQTLKQYINNEMSSILEVNQTKTFEENEKRAKEETNQFSPQYVQSVMTSKELCSLASDSTSFVVEKHVINRATINKDGEFKFGTELNHAKLIQSKEMLSQRKQVADEFRENDNSKHNKGEVKPRSPNNLKNFLNTIKQLNNQPPKTYHILGYCPPNGISSTRTFSEQTKQNNFMGANHCPDIAQLTYHQNSSHKMATNPMKSSVNVSLNRQYEKFMETQKSSLYTDPEFLKAIREDVDKILHKRKLKLTTNPEITASQQMPPNQIFINGKKVDPKPQPIASFITPISYLARPFSHSTVSQFR